MSEETTLKLDTKHPKHGRLISQIVAARTGRFPNSALNEHDAGAVLKVLHETSIPESDKVRLLGLPVNSMGSTARSLLPQTPRKKRNKPPRKRNNS